MPNVMALSGRERYRKRFRERYMEEWRQNKHTTRESGGGPTRYNKHTLRFGDVTREIEREGGNQGRAQTKYLKK